MGGKIQMSNNEFSIGVKRSLFNHRLVELRKKKFQTQQEVANEVGLTLNRYQKIEILKSYPTEMEAKNIAEYFDEDPYKLFPKWSFPVYGTRDYTQVVKVDRLQLESKEVLQLADPREIEEEVDKELLKEKIWEVMNTLSEREQRIIRLRFQLEDMPQGKDPTLENVGRIFGVSRDRIRQIESRAIRKLKHSSKIDQLKSFIIPTGV